MERKPLISIIVPIYKVENYLNRCVESIINQTYQNLEIVLVDDGSPDKCPQMCDAWANKDIRIKVIHKENGGLSDARNAGMRVAHGDFISFVDSDDYIEPDMLSKLYTAILSFDCDVASCRVNMVWDNKPSKPLTPSIETTVFQNNKDAMRDLINGNHLIQTVWNKLYKRTIISKIEFPVGKINEDEFWSWKVIAASNRIVCINPLLYNYYLREGSIMQGGVAFNPMPVLEGKFARNKFIENKMPELKDISRIDLLYSCLFQAQRSKMLLPKDKNKEFYKKIKMMVGHCCPGAEYIKSLSIKKRLRIESIYRCFGLVYLIQNTLGIGKESNI